MIGVMQHALAAEARAEVFRLRHVVRRLEEEKRSLEGECVRLRAELRSATTRRPVWLGRPPEANQLLRGAP